jgi:peptide/nickel transport system substrate-binding protein
VRGRDGVRAKGSQQLKMLFQTSTNAPRQKVQAMIKSAAAAAGIEVELKAVVASVYFSSDAGNPDTAGRFQADLQMHTLTRGGPDPGRLMEAFCSWLVASKANKWIGRNQLRWRNDEYDRVYRAAERELDPARRSAMLVRLNDIVCNDDAVIPIFTRPISTALGTKIRAPIGGWGNEASRIQDWYRSA